MRNSSGVVVAVLVVTAFVGGFAGVAAGSGPSTAAVDAPAAADTAEQCEFPITVTDATGEEITLEGPPERITTTNPSAAQTLWAIGARDRVVGVTQFAMYLEGADEKTDVSAEFGIDVERVVDTEPDLVLAPNASAEDVEPLRNAGETVYHFPEATDIDDIAHKTERIGLLTGECEAAAETNEWMYEEVEAVEDRTADIDRPAALYPLGSGAGGDIYVAAGNTFIDEIMTIGGVDNVADDHDGYPMLSPELIIDRDPELILVTDPEATALDEEPYVRTTAGQERNAVVMQVHYLNQPAPISVVESTATLADAVEEYNAAAESDDTPESDETDDADDTDAEDAEDDAVDDEAPGFGVVTAIVAALLATLAAATTARRER